MFIRLTAVLLLGFSISDVARADEPVPKVILSGLDAPCAVAVQPQAGAIFVVDAGAGQILKLDPNVPEKAVPLVTGLPAAPVRKPAVRFGQIGLDLLDSRTLIVAAWEKNGSQTLRLFQLPDEATPLKWADAKEQLEAAAAKPNAAATPQFCGVTTTLAAIYLSHNEADADSILKTEIKSDRTLGPSEPFLKLDGVDFPGALTSKGSMLIVAQLGKLDAKRDGTIVFFDARSGQRLLSLATGLRDVVGLAYCPGSGRLYAIDFSTAVPAEAGLYRLDATMVDSRQSVTAVKIVNLERPTALAFGPDRTAYVTQLGAVGSDNAKGKAAKRGSLVKITGDL